MQGLLSGKYKTADDVQPDRARTRHFARTRPHARHEDVGAEKETFDAVADVRQIAEELGQPMADIALAWLIAQPGVTSVIAGARDADQAHGIAHAGALNLQPGVVKRLSQATEALKAKLGPNPDMWQSKSRMR
jgi:aryl-alcohol dehydrogenase-like predicted oxidoreductase